MQVSFYRPVSGLSNRGKAQNTTGKQTFGLKMPVKQGVLSFMAIPSIAFMGRLIIPELPEGLKQSPVPSINIKNTRLSSNEISEPVVSYKVYPQDPLITSPQLYHLKGKVNIGPENNRVKTVDISEPAKPDNKGSYISGLNTPQFDRVNAYLFTVKTLKMYEEALGREVSWAFPSEQIKIHPRAGKMANAYYNRWGEEIKLFHFKHRFKEDQTCYTSEMADVVTHETGHAVLDALRPNYIGWGNQAGAIHEGFGDSTAMLVAMMNDDLIERVVKSTGGDLRKENVIASLAEQFGEAIYGNKLYLRNAINDLKMSDFTSGKESDEVHNFGRLFGGMFYDVIVEIAQFYSKEMPLDKALMKTREDLTKLFARAMGDFSPTVNVYYADIAKALLKADRIDFNGQYNHLLSKVFVEREVLDSRTIKSWEAEISNLPKIKINAQDLTSEKTIKSFVSRVKNELKLPSDNNYELESAYTNSFGETFIHLKAPRELELPLIQELEGSNYAITVYDGLSLGFDSNNKLFYKMTKNLKRRIINDAINDLKQTLTRMKENMDQQNHKIPLIYKESGNKKVLIKAPILEDPVFLDDNT